jgi:hypothetical protein
MALFLIHIGSFMLVVQGNGPLGIVILLYGMVMNRFHIPTLSREKQFDNFVGVE